MNFEWVQCSFFLKKYINNSQITINLTPYHKLQYLNEESQLKDIKLDVKIDFEKPLMYDETIGWNWHKSWNIPDISVQLYTVQKELSGVLKCLKNLYTEIYVVKSLISKQYSLCIEDLGLEGNTCIEFPNNKCIFSGLKFLATSYNNQGSKFHFLIVVYENRDSFHQQSKIILSRISSPIFVDSRKSARQVQLIKLKRLSAYIEPFEVGHLHKKFVKKESKKSKDYVEEQIENNLNGLYNYFGAANIRNKVKHPLFLSIKFNLCFFIFYNKNQFNGTTNKQIIQFVQQTLFQLYKNFQIYRPNTKLQTKKIIITIKNQNLIGRLTQHRKIPEFLQIINNQNIGIFVDIDHIPPCFQLVKTNQNAIQQYQALYTRFKKQNDYLYKNKQKQIKSNLLDISYNPKKNLSEEKPQIESQQNKRQKDKKEQVFEEDTQSLSEQSYNNQRPNIALKCQIQIDPIKKRILKLDDILDIYDSNNRLKQCIISERKLLANTRQLKILNELLKIQIQDFKNKSKLKQKQMSKMNAMNFLPQFNMFDMMKYS